MTTKKKKTTRKRKTLSSKRSAKASQRTDAIQQCALDSHNEKQQLFQRARGGDQQAIYDLRQRGWVSLIDELDFVFQHAMTGNSTAKETLLHVFSHVTRLMEDAANKTNSPDFAQQVASAAVNLTDTLERIVDQHPEHVADYAKYVNLWPMLARVTGKPRYNFDATVKQGLKMGSRLLFHAYYDKGHSSSSVLRGLLSGCVLDYETKQYRLLDRPPLALWHNGTQAERIKSMTEYAMTAFDELMGGEDWNDEVFKRKFPIREWINLKRTESVELKFNSLRGSVKSKISDRIANALTKQAKPKRK